MSDVNNLTLTYLISLSGVIGLERKVAPVNSALCKRTKQVIHAQLSTANLKFQHCATFGDRMTSEENVWTAAECDDLIEKYRASPCLWDVKSELYKDRIAREQSCTRVGIFRPDPTRESKFWTRPDPRARAIRPDPTRPAGQRFWTRPDPRVYFLRQTRPAGDLCSLYCA